MDIVAHSKKSLFQQKFHKKLYHFHRHFQRVWCKYDTVGLPESESDKKIRLRLLVLLGIRLRLHPKTSDSLWIRNPGRQGSILAWVIPKAWKTVLTSCPTSCWALMGGCGSREWFTRGPWLASSAAFTAKAAAHSPRCKQAKMDPANCSWRAVEVQQPFKLNWIFFWINWSNLQLVPVKKT